MIHGIIDMGTAHPLCRNRNRKENIMTIKTKITKTARKPAARKPVARKPAARKPVARKPAAKKPVTRKPAATKIADFAPIAKAARSYVDGVIAHEQENSKSSEAMGKALAALFPKREKRFGLRADGKSYRASNSNAPLTFVSLWSAVYDGAAVRHPDGKIQWVNEAQKKHRSNVWSAVLAYVRGEIETFSWNLSRQRTKEKNTTKGTKGTKPKAKETATESIMRRLKLIDGEIDKKIDAGSHAQNARALIRRAIEELDKIDQ